MKPLLEFVKMTLVGGLFNRVAALGEPLVIVQSNQRRDGHAAANCQVTAPDDRSRKDRDARCDQNLET
jgi:hypothetical protein